MTVAFSDVVMITSKLAPLPTFGGELYKLNPVDDAAGIRTLTF
jgi:hypothetical protein